MARAREVTIARSARGRGSASTGGSERSARSVGARACASTGGSEASGASARSEQAASKHAGGSGICEHGRERRKCEAAVQGVRRLRSSASASVCEHGRQRRQEVCEQGGCGGSSHLRAREGAKLLQGVRGLEHLRAREAAKQVQGVRGLEHMRAREAAKQVQGVRGLRHLRAREAEIRVQGVPRSSRPGGSRAPPPRPPQARDPGRARGRRGPGGGGLEGLSKVD